MAHLKTGFDGKKQQEFNPMSKTILTLNETQTMLGQEEPSQKNIII